MTEQREEQQDEAEPSGPLYAHLLPHEDVGPMLAPFAGWFKGAAGFLEVHVAYFVHEGGVLLTAVIVPPQAPPRQWLRHWSSHIEAARSAENLVAEAEAYLRQMTHGMPMRETEDLDYQDFIDHLRTRMCNEFH